jgi:hypothetical protein
MELGGNSRDCSLCADITIVYIYAKAKRADGSMSSQLKRAPNLRVKAHPQDKCIISVEVFHEGLQSVLMNWTEVS